MMYTFGNAAGGAGGAEQEAVAVLVEAEVWEYATDLVRGAVATAAMRGSLNISTEDVIFQIRNDLPKYTRVIEFLSWKTARSAASRTAARSSSASSEATTATVGAGPVTVAAGTAGDDDDGDDDNDAELKDMLSGDGLDGNGSGNPHRSQAASTGGGAVRALGGVEVRHMSWDLLCALQDVVGGYVAVDLDEQRAEEVRRKRLKRADDLTSVMSEDLYQAYAESRRVSFAQNRRRFMDWLRRGGYTGAFDSEVVDVLGFLAWEHVGLVTEVALQVQAEPLVAGRGRDALAAVTEQRVARMAADLVDRAAGGAGDGRRRTSKAGSAGAKGRDMLAEDQARLAAIERMAREMGGEAGVALLQEGAAAAAAAAEAAAQAEASRELDNRRSLGSVNEGQVREALRRIDLAAMRSPGLASLSFA